MVGNHQTSILKMIVLGFKGLTVQLWVSFQLNGLKQQQLGPTPHHTTPKSFLTLSSTMGCSVAKLLAPKLKAPGMWPFRQALVEGLVTYPPSN